MHFTKRRRFVLDAQLRVPGGTRFIHKLLDACVPHLPERQTPCYRCVCSRSADGAYPARPMRPTLKVQLAFSRQLELIMYVKHEPSFAMSMFSLIRCQSRRSPGRICPRDHARDGPRLFRWPSIWNAFPNTRQDSEELRVSSSPKLHITCYSRGIY